MTLQKYFHTTVVQQQKTECHLSTKKLETEYFLLNIEVFFHFASSKSRFNSFSQLSFADLCSCFPADKHRPWSFGPRRLGGSLKIDVYLQSFMTSEVKRARWAARHLRRKRIWWFAAMMYQLKNTFDAVLTELLRDFHVLHRSLFGWHFLYLWYHWESLWTVIDSCDQKLALSLGYCMWGGRCGGCTRLMLAAGLADQAGTLHLSLAALRDRLLDCGRLSSQTSLTVQPELER